jgi:hypothetical protein
MKAPMRRTFLRFLTGLAGLAVIAGYSQPAWAQSDADNNFFLTRNYFAVLGRYPDSSG